MTSAVARRAAVAVLAVVVVSGCAGSSSGSADEPATLADELCAIAAVAVDEPQTAADRFASDVHRPLHGLIDELSEQDRSEARQLLDAKFEVESLAREDDPQGGELRDALEQLAQQIPGSAGCGDQ